MIKNDSLFVFSLSFRRPFLEIRSLYLQIGRLLGNQICTRGQHRRLRKGREVARVRKTRLLMPLECSSHCLYTASYVHARCTSSNDKTSRRRSCRVDIGLHACAHASSIATFIPADPWNPRSVFEFATSGCDADREKRHPPAIQVCSFDPIEICILMIEDGLIVGDRYRHKGRRCRL